MPRFFAAAPVSAGPRTRLGALAISSDFPENWVRPVLRWNVADDLVAKFLQQALSDNIRVFHDAVFRRPRTSPKCKGAESFGSAIREELAKRYTLDGTGALVIIADSGVQSELLHDRLKVPFDPNVKGPARSEGLRVHGTMCAVDAYLAAPHATFGDLTVSTEDETVTSSLAEAFEGLLEAKEGFKDYTACVISVALQTTRQSAADDENLPGGVRLTANQSHPLWQAAQRLPENGFDVVIAAGNDGCHPSDSRIRGLALHPALLTVAAVDAGDRVEPRSSRGTLGAKPDVAAYTNFLWSQLEGEGTYDGGTSAATALAAGILASYRAADKKRHRSKLLPPDFRQHLQGALKTTLAGGTILSGHSPEYGWGIL